jgi:DNA repair protein RecO (recombination protein O)
VSRGAGEPWRDRLMRLPRFLADDEAFPDAAALADGFALTGFFLNRYVAEPRGTTLPPERERFIASVLQPSRNAPAA